MKTVGEILKSTREKKSINLDEVVAVTKIKKKFLKAIERNDFQALPSEVVARGFAKNYAEFLGISSKLILAIFKRDFKLSQKKEIIPQTFGGLAKQSGFSWNPRLTLAVVVGFVFLVLLAYLGYQYFSLVKSPRLEVFQPQENQSVTTSQLKVIGQTDPGAVVRVNGELATLLLEGDFNANLTLLPGQNKIVVEATSKLGRKTLIERTVFCFDTKR